MYRFLFLFLSLVVIIRSEYIEYTLAGERWGRSSARHRGQYGEILSERLGMSQEVYSFLLLISLDKRAHDD